MKLTYFQGTPPNFGDELNTFLWPRVLPPGFLDEDPSELFVGIGSILYGSYPKSARKIVMGTGYGGYSDLPDVHDGSWDVVFVRGPQTAKLLGLPAEKAISDGAIMIRSVIDALPPADPAVAGKVCFMPHFRSLARGRWAEACRMAGMVLLDPTQPFETVVAQIRGAKLVVTEAMHGAIISDALRTPWIAARPIDTKHHMKWTDWSSSLGFEHRFHDLWPSSIIEFLRRTAGIDTSSRKLNASLPARPFNHAFAYAAARRLQALARAEPQLSPDAEIARATERAEAAVAGFVATRSTVRA